MSARKVVGAGVALAILRHILQAFAGIVVTLGYLDEGTATELIGVLMSVGSLVWFLLERRKNERSRDDGDTGLDGDPGGDPGGGGGDQALRRQEPPPGADRRAR